jgi:hypothetical protein
MHPTHAFTSTIKPLKQLNICSGGAVQEVAALSSEAEGVTGGFMLGHGKPMF